MCARTASGFRILMVGFLIGLSPGATAAQRLADITTREQIDPGETAVAINPNDVDNIVAVTMDRGSGYTWVFVSTDGGRTWASDTIPKQEGLRTLDDAVRFLPDGRVVNAQVVRKGDRGSDLQNIRVNRFTNRGLSWEGFVDVSTKVTPDAAEYLPGLAVDRNPESEHFGNIYVCWTRFDKYESDDPNHKTHIYFSASNDGGRSFSSPVRISKKGGNTGGVTGPVLPSELAVGVNGEVFAYWHGPRGIEMSVSLDGGKTFGEEKTLFDAPQDLSSDSLPSIYPNFSTGVDFSASPSRGSLYLCWDDSTATGFDFDVKVARSSDGGATWQAPTTISLDPSSKGRKQFYSTMAVDPADGSINVLFYEMVNDRDHTVIPVISRSVDGGRTFQHYPIRGHAFVFDRTKVWLGDYNGIDAYNGTVAAAFSVQRDGGERTEIMSATLRFAPGTLTKSGG